MIIPGTLICIRFILISIAAFHFISSGQHRKFHSISTESIMCVIYFLHLHDWMPPHISIEWNLYYENIITQIDPSLHYVTKVAKCWREHMCARSKNDPYCNLNVYSKHKNWATVKLIQVCTWILSVLIMLLLYWSFYRCILVACTANIAYFA